MDIFFTIVNSIILIGTVLLLAVAIYLIVLLVIFLHTALRPFKRILKNVDAITTGIRKDQEIIDSIIFKSREAVAGVDQAIKIIENVTQLGSSIKDFWMKHHVGENIDEDTEEE